MNEYLSGGEIALGSKMNSKPQGIEGRLSGFVSSVSGDSVTDLNKALKIILLRYRALGANCFDEIDGSFSLVIEDYEYGEVYIVRDKIGTRPIYYASKNSTVYYAQRIKDILIRWPYSPEANHDVLHEYLAYRYISGRRTFFRNIYELLPGCYLRVCVEDGSVSEHRYWEIPYPSSGKDFFDSHEDLLIDQIERYIINFLSINFTKRTETCILSSGGVDSSVVVALSAKLFGSGIQTCFIGFDDYDSDRSADSLMVANLYKTEHDFFQISAKAYADALPETIAVHEEPLNHPGHVGRFLFNKAYAHQIKWLFMGEGVDTMFCGSAAYPLMSIAYVANPMRPITRMAFECWSGKGVPEHYFRYFRMIKDAFCLEPADYAIESLAVSSKEDAAGVLSVLPDLSYLDEYRSFFVDCNRRNILKQILRLNQHPFMVEVLNSEVKFGLECEIGNRYPFLEEGLVSFANFIPFSLRFRRFTGKYIIKRLAERYFPKSFVYRRKEGFGVPLKKYFRSKDAMGRYYDVLNDRKTRQRGIFRPSRLNDLIDRHRSQRMTEDACEGLIWTIVNIELWYRHYIDNPIVLTD